jgi:hypothetical protein
MRDDTNAITTQPNDKLATITTLEELELVVERGLKGFIGAGEALAKIRDGRFYRPRYGNFESYSLNRFGLKKAHAYRLIKAAEFQAKLSPNGDVLPSEAIARVMLPLDKAERMDLVHTVLEEAKVSANGGKVTAKIVEAAVKENLGQIPPSSNGSAATKHTPTKPATATPRPLSITPRQQAGQHVADLLAPVEAAAYRIAAERLTDAASSKTNHTVDERINQMVAAGRKFYDQAHELDAGHPTAELVERYVVGVGVHGFEPAMVEWLIAFLGALRDAAEDNLDRQSR